MTLAQTESPNVNPLIAAILNEDDVPSTVADAECPDELVCASVQMFVDRVLRNEDSCREEQVKVTAALGNERVKEEAIADPLIEKVFALALPYWFSWRYMADTWLKTANYSSQALSVVMERERKEWDVARLREWVEILAQRAGRFGAAKTRGSKAASRAAITELEKLFSDARAKQIVVEQVDSQKRRYALMYELGEAVHLAYPAFSLPLLDQAIELAASTETAKTFAEYCQGLQLLGVAATYSEVRANALLALKNADVDEALAKNPAISEANVWRIYARHVGNGSAIRAGQILAHRPEIQRHVEQSKLTAVAVGIAIEADRRSKAEWLSEDMVKLAATACIEHECITSDAGRALYDRLGEDELATLVRARNHEVTGGVQGKWLVDKHDGALLDALLVYPIKEVRMLLLGVKSYGNEYDTHNVMQMSPTVRKLYLDKIIPRLLEDRVEAIREVAGRMLMNLSHGKEPPQAALDRARAKDVIKYLTQGINLDTETLALLLRRIEADNEWQSREKAYDTLVTKSDLSIEQYRQLVATAAKGTAARVAKHLPATMDGAKELLLSLRERKDESCAVILAGRDLWEKPEREFFLNHEAKLVRAALARTCAVLGLDEVVRLLQDGTTAVRCGLMENPKWPDYATELCVHVPS